MLRELHLLGYERLRLVPSLSPSGTSWRFAILPVTKVSRVNGALESSFDFPSTFRDSFKGIEESAGIGDSREDSPARMAQLFLGRFPEIAAEGKGEDENYAAWYKEMLIATEPEDLICAKADYYHSDTAGYIATLGGDEKKIEMPPPGMGSPHTDCIPWSKAFNEDIKSTPGLSKALEEALHDAGSMISVHGKNFHQGLTTYPIPFFGDPESARVITVGVNPSAGEFSKKRGWPETIDASYLEDRLRSYFKEHFFPPPHPWFQPWEEALNMLGCSYKTDAAHLDLSPWATISMGSVKDKDLFIKMLREHLGKYFPRFLEFFTAAKLVMMAGAVTNKYYIYEFLHKFLPQGYILTGSQERKAGCGQTGWDRRFELKTPGRILPVYFFSKSPSDHNKAGLLANNVAEKKDWLLKHLGES